MNNADDKLVADAGEAGMCEHTLLSFKALLHTCSDPKCPGHINRLKLEKYDRLLELCHTAPKAVAIDTRDLETAIRRLVEFAWKAVRGTHEE